MQAQKTISDENPSERSYLEVQLGLEHWFQSTLGRALIASQRTRLGGVIERCYGVHQAVMGVSHRLPIGNASQLGHHFYVQPFSVSDMPENTLVSLSSELALESDSIDLMILHHALDFSDDPHQTLREAARVLKPSGHIALIGFNPLSMWGGVRMLRHKSGGLWGSRFISGKRVEDWLSLLDFKVETLKYYFYAPPLNSLSLIDRFNGLERLLNSRVPLGAYYIVLAKKQQLARVARQRSWARKAKVIGMPVANRVPKESNKEL